MAQRAAQGYRTFQANRWLFRVQEKGLAAWHSEQLRGIARSKPTGGYSEFKRRAWQRGTASSSEVSHIPSQPVVIPSSREGLGSVAQRAAQRYRTFQANRWLFRVQEKGLAAWHSEQLRGIARSKPTGGYSEFKRRAWQRGTASSSEVSHIPSQPVVIPSSREGLGSVAQRAAQRYRTFQANQWLFRVQEKGLAAWHSEQLRGIAHSKPTGGYSEFKRRAWQRGTASSSEVSHIPSQPVVIPSSREGLGSVAQRAAQRYRTFQANRWLFGVQEKGLAAWHSEQLRGIARSKPTGGYSEFKRRAWQRGTASSSEVSHIPSQPVVIPSSREGLGSVAQRAAQRYRTFQANRWLFRVQEKGLAAWHSEQLRGIAHSKPTGGYSEFKRRAWQRGTASSSEVSHVPSQPVVIRSSREGLGSVAQRAAQGYRTFQANRWLFRVQEKGLAAWHSEQLRGIAHSKPTGGYSEFKRRAWQRGTASSSEVSHIPSQPVVIPSSREGLGSVAQRAAQRYRTFQANRWLFRVQEKGLAAWHSEQLRGIAHSKPTGGYSEFKRRAWQRGTASSSEVSHIPSQPVVIPSSREGLGSVAQRAAQGYRTFQANRWLFGVQEKGMAAWHSEQLRGIAHSKPTGGYSEFKRRAWQRGTASSSEVSHIPSQPVVIPSSREGLGSVAQRAAQGYRTFQANRWLFGVQEKGLAAWHSEQLRGIARSRPTSGYSEFKRRAWQRGTASSSGVSHVPSQPVVIPSSREGLGSVAQRAAQGYRTFQANQWLFRVQEKGLAAWHSEQLRGIARSRPTSGYSEFKRRAWPRFGIADYDTEYTGKSGYVCGNAAAQEGSSETRKFRFFRVVALWYDEMEKTSGQVKEVMREPQNSAEANPCFQRGAAVFDHSGGTYSHGGVILRLYGISKLESQLQD